MSREQSYNLQPGTVIAGRFEVMKSLGSGSMGLVYACRDREFSGRIVALKVLFPEFASDETSMARFRNEIVASYRVSHPNVIRSFELIRDSDLVAYTMEYVEGGTLLDYIESDSLLSVNEAIGITIDICAGLQSIHDAEIVHRDMKPENILITHDKIVKIADFGIARTSQGPKLTEHGGVVGTIDYVSPEYVLESRVDWRSDIYALGIIFYEVLTGQSPFQGDSVYSVMTQRISTDPVPPSQLRKECSENLDKVVLKALARKPEERYQSAADFASDLSELYQLDEHVPLRTSAMQVLSKNPKDFQGPSLDLETIKSLANPVGISQTHSNAVISFDPVIPEIIEVEAKKAEREDRNYATTVSMEPEIIDIATYYSENRSKMESVLKNNRRKIEREPVTINKSSIDTQSMLNLKKSSQKKYLKDTLRKLFFIFFAMLAVVVGIASGYYLVDIIFKDDSRIMQKM